MFAHCGFVGNPRLTAKKAFCALPTWTVQEKELRSKLFGYEALNNTERGRLWKASRVSRGSARGEAGSESEDPWKNGGSAARRLPWTFNM